MALDLSQDHLLVDDPVTVYYRRKTADGDPSNTTSVTAFQTLDGTQTITYAQKSAITDEDVASNASWLNKDTAVFHLWRAVAPAGFYPRTGDRILHGSDFWVVDGVLVADRDTTGPQRFRVVCVRATGGSTP